MKIIIGADIVPTKSNKKEFSEGQVEKIIDEKVQETLVNADFRIFNLETPLTDEETPIKKFGSNLIAPVTCINGIKKLGVDLFTLANNHIMDHGVKGLKSTISALNKSGIDYVGVGESLLGAKKPYIIEKDGNKVGIYACAEHEFSIAENNSPGANPFDPLESLDHISDLKKQCDYVIVLYHGGKEHYRYPSPNLQKTCRKMCDKGADIVICQHSHCVGCEEKYNDATIIYGQGNFIFDAQSNEFWDSALLVELDISDCIRINYIPIEKKNGKISFSEKEFILKSFRERSIQIEDVQFVEEKYSEFTDEIFQDYLYAFYGVGFAFRLANKLCAHRLKKKIAEKKAIAIRNCVECESHREIFLKALYNIIEKR